jgi:hypothetical protein
VIRFMVYFLLTGLVWLFLFSIPVNQKRLFDWGYGYIVSRVPIQWVKQILGTEEPSHSDKISGAFKELFKN